MRVFRLPDARPDDPAVGAWFQRRPDALGALALRWFDRLRHAGPGVRELVHDDQATACVGDVAFAYVATYTAHVGVGFFAGTELADPAGLLQGSGRFMRHVKLRPGVEVDERALDALVAEAYRLAAAAD